MIVSDPDTDPTCQVITDPDLDKKKKFGSRRTRINSVTPPEGGFETKIFEEKFKPDPNLNRFVKPDSDPNTIGSYPQNCY